MSDFDENWWIKKNKTARKLFLRSRGAENVIFSCFFEVVYSFMNFAFFSGGLGLQTYRKTCHEACSESSSVNQTLHALRYDENPKF